MLHLLPIEYDGLRHCVSIFDIYAVRFSLIFYLNHKSLLRKKNRTFLYYRYLLINKAELCLKRSSLSYIEKSIHPSIYLYIHVYSLIFVCAVYMSFLLTFLAFNVNVNQCLCVICSEREEYINCNIVWGYECWNEIKIVKMVNLFQHFWSSSGRFCSLSHAGLWFPRKKFSPSIFLVLLFNALTIENKALYQLSRVHVDWSDHGGGNGVAAALILLTMLA